MTALRFDNPTHDVQARDRRTEGLLPVAWSNDAGGVTLGLRSRSNYLGRFERSLSLFSAATDRGAPDRYGFSVRMENPVTIPVPRTTIGFSVWSVEGRSGAALSVDRDLRRRWVDQTDTHVGFDAIWMAVTGTRYVDRRLWDDAGTLEAGPWITTVKPVRGGMLRANLGVRSGAVCNRTQPGILSVRSCGLEGFLRPTGAASLRHSFVLGTTLGVRLFGGAYLAHSIPPLQRRIMVSGADPYETFTDPLLRSRGALFVRPDFHYQAPGDANLRGFDPTLGGRWALSMSAEWTRRVLTRQKGLVRNVQLETFGDAGIVDTLAVPSTAGHGYTALGDAGVGLLLRHQVGDLAWTTRFEFPLVVSRKDFAADRRTGDGTVAFRWLVSLSPSF